MSLDLTHMSELDVERIGFEDAVAKKVFREAVSAFVDNDPSIAQLEAYLQGFSLGRADNFIKEQPPARQDTFKSLQLKKGFTYRVDLQVVRPELTTDILGSFYSDTNVQQLIAGCQVIGLKVMPLEPNENKNDPVKYTF